MTPMATGLFCDSYSPVLDGVTMTVANYAYWLGRTFGPATIVTPSSPGYADEDPLSVLRFLSLPTVVRPPYRIGLPHLDPRLARSLDDRDFAIVHAHSPFGAGHVALETARKKGIPVVATLHSKFRDDLRRFVPFKALVDWEIGHIVEFLYAVDQVWVPQESVALTLREYGYKGPYEVVENGIDLEPPADLEPFRRRGRELLGLPGDAPVGLYVGQHIMEKNLEFLVRSLPAILGAVPEFRMVFVGEGYARDELAKLAAELGISGQVSFLEAVRDRETLKAVYAAADLFLFPSIYDNAPLVVREAAAFDTPSVLLEGSTAAEVIRDGENGFLSPNDREAFSAKVIGILADEASRLAAGRGARQTLCRSWQEVVREVTERYSAILARWA